MEIFRNYISRNDKKLTMEDSWSKVCCRWANSLDISDVKDLMSLIDGKFFADFITKYLPSWSFSSNTASETWSKMETLFNEEFSSGSLIKFAEARAGHEEELTKMVSLFMYLGTVRYPNPSLAATLQDGRLFSKEIQLRIKCILQAFMEQHNSLNPALINEILMAKVSETTGQLVEPIKRNRVAERSSAISRVAKPTIGSPVIFSSNGSPLKEFLDSPLTRQVAKHQKQIEDKNGELRELKVELDKERMEKQFLAEENIRIKQERRRLESDNSDLKMRIRDISDNCKSHDTSAADPDLADQYHNLLREHKEQEKYLTQVQQELIQVSDERSQLESRLSGVTEKLASANNEKISAELCVTDMKTNLTAAHEENDVLSENVEELKSQIQDLNWQIENSMFSGGNAAPGRKSFAPSIASIHLTDMTDVSLDADDSINFNMDVSENLGDVVGRQLQEKCERIEELERDKEKLEDEILEGKANNDGLQKELDTKREVMEEMRNKIKTMEVDSQIITEELNKERIERGIEVNGLNSEIENLKENLNDERNIHSQAVAQLNNQITETNDKVISVESSLTQVSQLLKEKEAELTSVVEVKNSIEAEKSSSEKESLEQIDVLTKHKINLESVVKSVTEEKENIEHKSALLEENIQQLNDQLVQSTEKCQELEEKYSVSRTEIAEHLAKVSQLESNLKEIENRNTSEISSAEERLDAIQEEKLKLVFRIEDLEKDLKTVEQERDQLCLNKGKLDSEISGLKEHSQNLKARAVEKEEEVENLKDDMETQRKYHLNKDAELRNAKDKIAELEKKIGNLEDTKGREITNIRTDLDSKCKSLANLQKVLEDTKEELRMKEQDGEKFMNNLTSASSALGEMKVELSEAKERIETMEMEIENKNSEADQLRNNITLILEEKTTLLLRIEENEASEKINLEKIQLLETEKLTKQSESDELSIEMSALHTQVSTAKQEIAQWEEKFKEISSSKLETETQMELLQQEKTFALSQIELLNKKNEEYLRDLENCKSEMKDMEETMESNEHKRQEIILEKQRLEETLGEVGANCDKRGTELNENLEKIRELESRLTEAEREKEDKFQELTNEIEFIRSQMEEANVEKDKMAMETKQVQDKHDQVIAQAEAAQKKLEDELKSKSEEIEKMKEDLESIITTLRSEVEVLTNEKNALVEKSVETENLLKSAQEETLKLTSGKSEEMNVLTESISNLEAQVKEKSETLIEKDQQLVDLNKNLEESMEKKSQMEIANRNLEEKLREAMSVRDQLAASTSQLMTNTNEMKESAQKMNDKHVREKEELSKQLQEKQEEINEVKSQLNEKSSLLEELAEVKSKNVEYEELIKKLNGEIEELKKELATLEIKLTDFEQENQGESVKEALKAQRQRFEENHKSIVEKQAEKYKSKMEDILKQAQQMIDKKDEDMKKMEKDKADVVAKCEYYKKNMTEFSKKQDELEILNKRESDVLQEKLENVLKKYETAKMVIEKINGEKENLQVALEETDAESLKREVAKYKAENKNLTNMLNYAETKLREQNRNENRPVTRSRDSSIGSVSSLDHKSRDSIGNSLSQFPRTSSRQSLDNNSSIVRARPSVPGRADRMSTRSNTSQRHSVNLDDSVFKIPGPNTPGRSKTGRTVSDSRMKAGYNRPPLGSGNFFSCDEEAGEMFSNSYLADLKSGSCEVDSSDRMSELARRNTLCPPHLKSAYPVESQFCEDRSMTEEAIRQSKLSTSRRETMAVSSPATRMSKLSLDDSSPAASTRSKRALVNRSIDSDQPPSKIPAPVAFNIDAPKPGTAIRKNATKKTCVGDHGTKKPCEKKHETCEPEEILDDVCDDSILSPNSEKRKRSEASSTRSQERISEDLDTSQDQDYFVRVPRPLGYDSNISTFSRSSVRSSKRLRGETGYTRPGPPTPGRNKSLGNLSLPKDKINTSSGSLDTTTQPVITNPGVSCNTPDMSRVSARSQQSLKTPLLDQTNTPKAKNTSKIGRTPINFKKFVGSAFRSKKSKSYKMMDIQDKTINRDQNNLATPMKAKEKSSKSPVKKMKV